MLLHDCLFLWVKRTWLDLWENKDTTFSIILCCFIMGHLFRCLWYCRLITSLSSQSIDCGSTYTANPQYPTNTYYPVPYVTILSDGLFLVSWASNNNGVTKNKYYTVSYTGNAITALNDEFTDTPYSNRGGAVSFKLHATYKTDNNGGYDISFSWYDLYCLLGVNKTCYKYDNLLHANGPNNQINIIHKAPYINYNALDPILSDATGKERLLSDQSEYTSSGNYYILKWLKPNDNTIYFAICWFDDFINNTSDINVYQIMNAFDYTTDGSKGIARIVYSQSYFTLLWISMKNDSPRRHLYGITYSFTGRQETGVMKLNSDTMINSSMNCGIHHVAARIRHDGKLLICYGVCGVGYYSNDIACVLVNQLTLNIDDSDVVEKRLIQNPIISQSTPLIAVYPNDNAMICYKHHEGGLNPEKLDHNLRCFMIDETLNIIVNPQQISFNDWINNHETDGYFSMQPVLYGNPYRFIITWQHAERLPRPRAGAGYKNNTYQWVKVMVCSDSSRSTPPSSSPSQHQTSTNNPTPQTSETTVNQEPEQQTIDATHLVPLSWVLKESLNCHDGFQDADVDGYCEPCPDPYVGTVGKCNIKCGWSEEPSDQRDECQLSSGIEALIIVCSVLPVIIGCISAFIAKLYGCCCFKKEGESKEKSYSAIDPHERTQMTNISATDR
eukprot:25437_1